MVMTSLLQTLQDQVLSWKVLGTCVSTLSQMWAGSPNATCARLVITDNRRCCVLIRHWTSCCQEMLDADVINVTRAYQCTIFVLLFFYCLFNHKRVSQSNVK
jgi:hypothetical protein